MNDENINPLDNPWIVFDGNYSLKEEYDLLLKNGKVIYNCRVDNNYFKELMGKGYFKFEIVLKIRESIKKIID